MLQNVLEVGEVHEVIDETRPYELIIGTSGAVGTLRFITGFFLHFYVSNALEEKYFFYKEGII